ncbi:MAG TPA: ABC transporter substrate-binding protein, partial [Thermomicrobiales bacterium]|nr:ABC transporter substrate-binding protein [Thermomicrobiales bacterium]
TGLPFPDLATEVPTQQNGGISADGLTYTFKLRPGIKWSDGQPLTAKDVVFTYTVMTDPKLASPRSGELTERVASVSAADDLTAVFKMKKVVAPFLVTDMFPICPEHILGSVPPDQIKSHPFSTGDPKATVGTGPFKFKEWVKDDHATFEKNPLYFRGEPALDEYVFKVVKDQGVVAAQLKTGEADYGGITPSLVADMSKQANLNVVNYNTYSWSFYAYQMNPQKSPFFLDKRVRQALAYALDREAMLKAIYFGFGEVAQGTIPDSSWAYAPDQITTKYTFDLTKANQLLDAAGWAKGADGIRAKDGKRFSFTLWTGVASQVYQQLCTAAQQMWKAVGVEATVKPEEWNAFISRISDARDFDIFLEGFSWGVDPDQTIMFRTGANLNRNPYSNPDVDKLLDQGLSELDQAKRKQIYIQMENILWDDLPSLPIADTQALAGLNKRVHNFFPNATNIRWNAHTWWVADGK